MSEQTKNNLLPALRFPDFKDNCEWRMTTFGEVTFPAGLKNRDNKKYPIYSINNIVGFLPQSDQFDGVDSNARGYDISLYKIVERNTFAYNPARIDVGSIGYSGSLNNVIISSLYVCFKTTDEVDDAFLGQYIKSKPFNESVRDGVEGGIRKYLFYENLARIKFCLPSCQAEQQKIADTLSSLDDLLTAENQKLEALKAHKKGLMQQLFPAEGQTVPALRFDEFKDSEDWEEKKLGELGDVVTGSTPSTTNAEYYGNDYQFVSPADISDKRYVLDTKTKLSKSGFEQTRQIRENSVLFVCIGSTIGKVAQNKMKCATNQQLNAIVSFEEYSSDFIYSLLEFKARIIAELAGKQAVPIINKSLFSSVVVTVPSKREQQKIADTLSSTDTLITAQSIRIDQLKQHKKGLMQGLFPNI